MIRNPVIPGFYPDPSVCRVGADYYLVCSSFSTFPGIPLFHSTDLAHWEQIAYVLDRPSQLHVTADSLIAGIMAPTIRYHEGTFYVIACNMSDKGNLLVTATDPRGPWSEPTWLTDVPGIDASLFFDDDGTAYVAGTGRFPGPDGAPGPQCIWGAPFDLATRRLAGPRTPLWGGALVGCASPEAPHIYHRDGWYVLVIAEGGTEHFHAVTVARSRGVLGPYEGFTGNPVLTHRHLGKEYPIGNPGHADLLETQGGDWHAVLLASRLVGGFHKNLGRETYLCPVTWEDGWPVFSPGTGRVEWTYPGPALPVFRPTPVLVRDDFDGDRLGFAWRFVGTPYQPFHRVAEGRLTLHLLPRAVAPELVPTRFRSDETPDTSVPPLALVVRIQQDVSYRIATRLTFVPRSENEAAGLVVLQASNHQFRLERGLAAGRQVLRLVQVTCEQHGRPYLPGFSSRTSEVVLASAEVPEGPIVLEIRQRAQDVGFYHGTDEATLQPLAEGVDGRTINPEDVGGMVGTMLGLFATSNGQDSANSAAFDWFDYEALLL